MSLKIFQHAGAPAWRQQLDGNDAVALGRDPTRWYRNNSWDGTIGWERDLHKGLWMPKNDVETEVEVRKRTLGDGSDSYIHGTGTRVLEVTGAIHETSEAEMFDVERRIKSWAIRPFLKLAYRDDCYINLGALRGIDWEVRPASGRGYARVRITWQIDDPYWYDMALTVVPHQGSSPVVNITMGDEDLHQPVWPVIELYSRPTDSHTDYGNYNLYTAMTYSQHTGGDNSDGPSFTIGDPLLGGNFMIRIDSEAGSIYKAQDFAIEQPSSNMIPTFSGRLWPLYPGDNYLVYQGTYIYQLIKYRKRWT